MSTLDHSNTSSRPSSAKHNVLIVDDEVALGKLYVALLEEEGHEASLFTKAEDALEYLTKETPDIILLDYRLPTMSGEEFLSVLKLKNPKIFEKCFLVGFSSFSDGVRLVENFKEGVDRFVTKPHDIEEFLSLVHQFFAESDKKKLN